MTRPMIASHQRAQRKAPRLAESGGFGLRAMVSMGRGKGNNVGVSKSVEAADKRALTRLLGLQRCDGACRGASGQGEGRETGS